MSLREDYEDALAEVEQLRAQVAELRKQVSGFTAAAASLDPFAAMRNGMAVAEYTTQQERERIATHLRHRANALADAANASADRGDVTCLLFASKEVLALATAVRLGEYE